MLALVSWGVWGFFMKLASRHYEWHHILLLSSLFTFIFSAMVQLYFRSGIRLESLGFLATFVASLCGFLALVGFFLAMERGEASIIVPLTALYPVITVLLSTLLLGERVTMLQGVGITLAILAVLLVSME
jgi:transporter family protein